MGIIVGGRAWASVEGGMLEMADVKAVAVALLRDETATERRYEFASK